MNLKKLVVLLAVIFSFNFVSAQSSGSETNLYEKVFLIKAYEKESTSYTYKQLGSSVLIENDKVITNAHVILNQSIGKPMGNYEICKTGNFKEEPICLGNIKLLYFNKEKDLAVLQFSGNLGSPVVKGSDPNIGDMIDIYGYPAIGGKTITLSEGKISGFDNGYYKTDATIDQGNSGGGAFDSKGNFVGIPSLISSSYSTLGYIIPISTIKDFLINKTGATDYTGENQEFADYILKKNNISVLNGIDNDYFSFTGLGNYGYKITDSKFSVGGTYYSYSLKNDTTNTNLAISMIKTLIGSVSITEIMDSLATTGKVKAKSVTGDIGMIVINDKYLSGNIYYMVKKADINTYILVSLYKKGDLNGGLMQQPEYKIFTDEINIKKKDSESNKSFDMEGIKINSVNGISLMDLNGINIIFKDNDYDYGIVTYENGSNSDLKSQLSGALTLNDFIETHIDYLKDYGANIKNALIKSNLNGVNYYLINGETYDYYEGNKKFLKVGIVTKDGEDKYIEHMFVFYYKNNDTMKKALNLIETIELKGQQIAATPKIYKNTSAKDEVARTNADKIYETAVSYQNNGNIKKAFEYFNKARIEYTKIYKTDKTVKIPVINSLWGMGYCFGELGQYKKSIQVYNIIVKLGFDDYSEGGRSIYKNLGLMYTKLGDYTNAKLSYQKAMTFDDDNDDIQDLIDELNTKIKSKK